MGKIQPEGTKDCSAEARKEYVSIRNDDEEGCCNDLELVDTREVICG